MKSDESLSRLAPYANDIVTVGLYHLERLIKGGQPGYDTWARAVHKDLGPEIEPVLPHLYRKLTESPPPRPATLTRTTQRAPFTGTTIAIAKRR